HGYHRALHSFPTRRSSDLFAFLKAEWPEVHEATVRAESLATSDPRGACFYARRAVELAVQWMYKHDGELHLPYSDNLSALIHERSEEHTSELQSRENIVCR